MNILPIEGIGAGQVLTPGRAESKVGFENTFKQALSDANALQLEADQSMVSVTEGKLGLSEGMLKMGEADLSLRLLVQVRNKIVDAYKEISRM